MKILAFTDAHNSDSAFRKVKKEAAKHNVDYIVCCGDFTFFSHELETVMRKMNSFGKKVIVIPGNHESDNQYKKNLKKFSNLIDVHKGSWREGDVLVIGYGGG